MTTENYVYKKEVDWSLLNEGLTLPFDNQVVFFHEVETKKEKQTKYEAKIYTFEQFINAQELHGENKDFFIREIVFKKLRLATISV